MKASSIAQSFKWLADKIHPQLPLTTRESQRLLGALNSSFRQHLDEAHPTTDDRDETHKRGVSKSNTSALHSSAHAADKHLASVLTNPLFTRIPKDANRLSYMTAKAELAKGSHKDPLELLEEYHEKSAATVHIAELCIESSFNALASFSVEERHDRIMTQQPGRRALFWLSQNALYDPELYVQKARFIDFVAYFLIVEGCESSLWDWIKIDMRTTDDGPRSSSLRVFKTIYPYRWRGQLLQAMIKVKLGQMDNPEPIGPSAGSIHEALKIYFSAYKIKRSVTPDNHLHWIPLGGSYELLQKALIKDFRSVEGLDVRTYDSFAETTDLAFHRSEDPPKNTMPAKVSLAQLDLAHPRKPSAGRAYRVLRELFCGNTLDRSAEIRRFLTKFRRPKTESIRHRWFSFMRRTIQLLGAEGRHEEATWVRKVTAAEFPDLARSHLGDNEVSPRLESRTTVSDTEITGNDTSDFQRILLPGLP